MHYLLPVMTFAYCYGRIFRTIRRQSKVVAGHAGRSHNIAMTTTRGQENVGQVQQQATGASETGNKLSHTELNVLQTMIAVIVCFMICFTVGDIANFFQLFGVSSFSHNRHTEQLLHEF